jgi:hypothetical protein
VGNGAVLDEDEVAPVVGMESGGEEEKEKCEK